MIVTRLSQNNLAVENKVTFQRMKGDCYRHIALFSNCQERDTAIAKAE